MTKDLEGQEKEGGFESQQGCCLFLLPTAAQKPSVTNNHDDK